MSTTGKVLSPTVKNEVVSPTPNSSPFSHIGKKEVAAAAAVDEEEGSSTAAAAVSQATADEEPTADITSLSGYSMPTPSHFGAGGGPSSPSAASPHQQQQQQSLSAGAGPTAKMSSFCSMKTFVSAKKQSIIGGSSNISSRVGTPQSPTDRLGTPSASAAGVEDGIGEETKEVEERAGSTEGGEGEENIAQREEGEDEEDETQLPKNGGNEEDPISIGPGVETAAAEGALSGKEARRRAEEASILGRQATFVPYNPWSHDVAHMATLEEQLDEPVELTVEENAMHVKLAAFQSDNNAVLKHQDCFGFNFQTLRTLAHAQDDKIVYACGRHVTTVGIDDPTHRRMLLRGDKVISINNFCVSSNGKYIAVSERKVDTSIVCVYRLDSNAKVTTLNFKFLSKTQVSLVDFSSNNKFLATVTSLPDQKLMMWQLDDVRVIAMEEKLPSEKPILEIKVNPWHSTSLSTITENQLLLWKINQKTLTSFDPLANAKHRNKLFGGGEPNLLAHCWYDEECLAVLTSDGYILALESNEVVHYDKIKLPMNSKDWPVPTTGNPASSGIFSSQHSSPTTDPSASSLMMSRSRSGSQINRGGASHQQQQPPSQVAQPDPRLTHMAWASRGLVVGGRDGVVVLLDRTYLEPTFVQVACFHTSTKDANILAMSVSPAELNLVVALSNNTMEVANLSALDLAIEEEGAHQEESQQHQENGDCKEEVANDNETEHGEAGTQSSSSLRSSPTSSPKNRGTNSRKAGEAAAMDGLFLKSKVFKPITHVGFHMGTVTSVSMAIQRPIIVTTGIDCTLAVYDYQAHNCLVRKQVEDEILCGSVHPMGLHVVVGFRFSARVYALVEDDAIPLTEMDVKAPTCAQFSRNGAKIAFAITNRIVIYDGHSYKFLGMLIGHTSSVKGISWSHEDQRITSCDISGMIISWCVLTMKRINLDSAHKNIVFQTAMLHPDTGLFAAIGSSKHAKGKVFEGEFTVVCAAPESDESIVYVRPGMVLPRQLATRKVSCKLLAFAEVSKTLFVGTPTGRVLLYSWPLLKTSRPYDFVDSHCAEIVQLILTPDERFLLTVSSDHTLYMYNVEQMKGGKYVTAKSFDFSLFSNVKYRVTTDTDDLDRDVYVLKGNIDDRKADYNHTITNIKSKKEMEAKSSTSIMEAKLEQLRKQIDAVSAEKELIESRGGKELGEAEAAHIHTSEEVENVYNKREAEAYKQWQKLNLEKDDLLMKYESVISKKVSEWEAEKQAMEMKRREREKVLNDELSGLRAAIVEKARVYDAMLVQSVVDYETETSSREEKFRANAAVNEEQTQKATTYASAGDREAERLKREIVHVQTIASQRQATIQSLQQQAERMSKENTKLHKRMREKQELINVEEKKMQQLKQQLTILENMRFVLTHQFEAVQGEVVPKDGEIRSLERRITDMEEDLQILNVERNSVKERVIAADERLEGLGKDQQKVRVSQFDQDRKMGNFIGKLEALLESYRDPLQFAVKLQKSVTEAQKTFSYHEKTVDSSTKALNDELARHTAFLRAKNAVPMDSAKERHQVLDAGNKDIINENSVLVDEIKALRKERKQLHLDLSQQETALRDVRLGLQRLVATSNRVVLSISDGSENNVSSVGLPAPSETPLLTDTPDRPSGAQSAPLTRVKGKPPSGSSGGMLPPIQRSASARSATPPDGVPSSTRTPTPTMTRSSTPEVRKGTTLVKKKAKGGTGEELPPSTKKGGKKKTSSSTTRAAPGAGVTTTKKMQQQTQLHQMINQLDANTETMMKQQKGVMELRGFVQELLVAEEERLLAQLHEGGTSSSMRGASTGTTAAAAAPVGGVAAGATTRQEEEVPQSRETDDDTLDATSSVNRTQPVEVVRGGDESPDWEAPPRRPGSATAAAARGGRPMTPPTKLS